MECLLWQASITATVGVGVVLARWHSIEPVPGVGITPSWDLSMNKSRE